MVSFRQMETFTVDNTADLIALGRSYPSMQTPPTKGTPNTQAKTSKSMEKSDQNQTPVGISG